MRQKTKEVTGYSVNFNIISIGFHNKINRSYDKSMKQFKK